MFHFPVNINVPQYVHLISYTLNVTESVPSFFHLTANILSRDHHLKITGKQYERQGWQFCRYMEMEERR